MVAAVADALRKNDSNCGPVLRKMFSSAEFYSARVIRSQIKSPVQFLVQTCKLLEMDLPPQKNHAVRAPATGPGPAHAAECEGLGWR
jgi:uncharacterized protein (DUF1800 family)